MPVQIHGKEYRTVAERRLMAQEMFPHLRYETDLLYHDDERVITKTVVKDDAGNVLASGLAEENRATSNITRTSAVEVSETSSLGRCLAILHPDLAGSEIASADEVSGAIKAQAALELIEYNALVREHFYEIAEAKSSLEPKWGEHENAPNVTHARAVLKELGNDVYQTLWKAPTKGGIFTTQERAWLKEPPEGSL